VAPTTGNGVDSILLRSRGGLSSKASSPARRTESGEAQSKINGSGLGATQWAAIRGFVIGQHKHTATVVKLVRIRSFMPRCQWQQIRRMERWVVVSVGVQKAKNMTFFSIFFFLTSLIGTVTSLSPLRSPLRKTQGNNSMEIITCAQLKVFKHPGMTEISLGETRACELVRYSDHGHSTVRERAPGAVYTTWEENQQQIKLPIFKFKHVPTPDDYSDSLPSSGCYFGTQGTVDGNFCGFP